MIHAQVPIGRKADSWVGNITTREQYNVLVSTGMAWVLFSDLPLTWEECLKVLEEKEKQDE